MRWWAGGGSPKGGSRGGVARVSPSHVGSGAWTARPAIVGGGGNPWALKLLIPFSLQHCGCVVQRPGPFSVFARCLSIVVHSLCLRGV